MFEFFLCHEERLHISQLSLTVFAHLAGFGWAGLGRNAVDLVVTLSGGRYASEKTAVGEKMSHTGVSFIISHYHGVTDFG